MPPWMAKVRLTLPPDAVGGQTLRIKCRGSAAAPSASKHRAQVPLQIPRDRMINLRLTSGKLMDQTLKILSVEERVGGLVEMEGKMITNPEEGWTQRDHGVFGIYEGKAVV